MITLRNGAAAFLKNNGKYLLIKRSKTRRIAPGFWSSIGGHMEPDEINDPYRACYREIYEESGITQASIHKLELLYIITRKAQSEIRLFYIFFGETSQTDIIQTDEGELLWVPEEELLNREYTKTFEAMLRHYMQRSPDDRALYVGVAGNDNRKLQMSWSKLEDFENYHH
jgi:8-oxo-dGTP diphosphatase